MIQATPTVLSLILASCLAPTQREGAASAEPALAARTQGAVAALFQKPKSGIALPASERGSTSLEQVVADFERATGLHLIVSPDARAILERAPCGLQGPLEIPSDAVYPVVESLLAQNGVLIVPLHAREPRLAALHAAQGQAAQLLRQHAWTVQPDELPALADHPAVLVQTVLDLDGIDARNLSNTLRGLLVDMNTQQVVPLGGSDQVVLYGTGRQVANWAAVLTQAAARERERQAAERKQHDEEQRARPRSEAEPR